MAEGINFNSSQKNKKQKRIMKDNEFNEKVPMICALNKSTLLFNKGNYEKAIEILEEVLKQDPSMDFKESIRYDVWYNLSVNYILAKQYDKAYSAIIKFIKRPEYIQPGYRVFFNEVLTQDQKKMLMSNYRLEHFKFYMDISKYRKAFNLFVQELGSKLNQIENDAKEKNYSDLILELNFFNDIVLNFADTGSSDVFSKERTITYIFSNNDLVNIFNKVQDLINKTTDQENESLIKALEEDILNVEEKIKNNLFSETENDLINILEKYYNFQLGNYGSLIDKDITKMKLKENYNSDEKFKKLIDYLILIKEKEKEKKNIERKNAEELLISELLKAENMIQNNFFTDIEKNLKEVIEKAKSMKFNDIIEKAKAILKNSKNEEQRQKNEEEYFKLENLVNEYDLVKTVQLKNLTSASSFLEERYEVGLKLYNFYGKVIEDRELKEKIIILNIIFYSQHINFNPFDANIQHFATTYNLRKKTDIAMIENCLKLEKRRREQIEKYARKRRIKVENQEDKEDQEEITTRLNELKKIYNKISVINNQAILNQQLKKIAEETRELAYDVPLNIMYNYLLDFSNLFTNNQKIEELSNNNEYTLKSSNGNLRFRFLEKEPNRKIVYEYDFLNNIEIGEKGKFTIEFIEETPGKIKLKTKNEIEEISKDNKENLRILNYLGNNLGPLIDLILAKLVAKQVQTIVYEKTFDDLTMGNYRILQAKLNAIGKDIDKLKAKYFEVKAPLSLTSFDCSECGATLNIASKEEKFVICEHCNTPFLMEWQKE